MPHHRSGWGKAAKQGLALVGGMESAGLGADWVYLGKGDLEQMRVKQGEYRAASECKGGGSGDPRENQLTSVPSSTIPTRENLGATQPEIELGSPSWRREGLEPPTHLTHHFEHVLQTIARLYDGNPLGLDLATEYWCPIDAGFESFRTQPRQNTLSVFEKANVVLQSQKPQIHMLRAILIELFKDVITRFVKPTIVRNSSSVLEVDYHKRMNLKEDSDITIGNATSRAMCDLKPEEKWSLVGKIKSACGHFKYAHLSKVMLTILTIPHSIAESERIFSQVRKTRTQFRLSMSSETLDKLMVVKARQQGNYEQNFDSAFLKKAKSASRESLKKKSRHTLAAACFIASNEPGESVSGSPEGNDNAKGSVYCTGAQIVIHSAIIHCSGQPHSVRALIDPGSRASFITLECLQKLQQPYSQRNSPLTALGYTLLPAVLPDEIIMVEAIVVLQIASSVPQTPIRKQGWPYLSNLELAKPNHDKPQQVNVVAMPLAPKILMQAHYQLPALEPVHFDFTKIRLWHSDERFKR
ncbi:hypothetical protein PR048_022320 [Dryococelus australis]|uniref:HAT C-terminal dimerisation domain-containing protein n=1 Tax=Dryococelus australis TaxID=614101 RepID=A0ABQ9H0N6_9NEOP|nr:hypothetical protein PR048_022320 [Dryococelus australis]